MYMHKNIHGHMHAHRLAHIQLHVHMTPNNIIKHFATKRTRICCAHERTHTAIRSYMYYMYARIYTPKQTYTPCNTQPHTQMHARMPAHAYTHTCTHADTHPTYMHKRVNSEPTCNAYITYIACIHACMHARMYHIHTHATPHPHVHAYIHVLRTQTCITCMHTSVHYMHPCLRDIHAYIACIACTDACIHIGTHTRIHA